TLSLLLLGAADDLRLLAFKEVLAPMIFDTGRIAFINGWAEVTAAQIGTSSDVNPAIGQIAFGQGSAYVPLPVGTNRVFWQRVDGNGQGGIVQDRDPFITENGLVYLYILTSDRDPVIITDAVEVMTDVIALPTAADVFVEVTPIPRTRIRVVNALYEQLPFDFVANGEIVATNLGYGQASALVELGDFITVPVSIAQPGASVPLIQRDLRLLEVGDYSVYVYGAVGDVSMIAFSDQGLALGSAPPSARVINLAGDASITLGLADAEATDPNTPSGGTAPGIPIGTLLLLQNIGVQSVSPQIPTFGGVRDLIVVDQRTNTEAARFRSFNFVSSTHYDVVVTYLPLEGVLRAFILPY
ncbi:MAG: DUF4397 domain-containing protein, partial [Armatimonadetes bacterium]|nr:DUF4397 domain-containing protein [Anaerolineae bacterium]